MLMQDTYAPRAPRYELLLVDDEPPLRKAVTKYLEQRGYGVTAVESGEAALAHMRATRPDIVISDITMPGMDGLQFLMLLRSYPQLRDIPVIFLTARGMTQDRIIGYRAGANAYLPKPFDPEELISIIDNLLVSRQSAVGDMQALTRELGALKEALKAPGGPSTNSNFAAAAGSNGAAASAISGTWNGRVAVSGTPLPSAPSSSSSAAAAAAAADPTAPNRSGSVSLTSREQEVLNLLCKGFTNREISSSIDGSVRVVENHVRMLMQKTNTRNRTELVRFALENGLNID